MTVLRAASFNCTFLTVLLLISSVYSTNIVSYIANGNLSDSWKFNVTIFAKDLKGMILYCVDSALNRLSIRVNIAMNSKKFIIFSFNNVFIRSSLNQICGCDPCDGKFMNFRLDLTNGTIFLVCNKYGKDSLKESTIKDTIQKSILKIMKNLTNSLYIGMGNIDETEDLMGCLESFYFNRTKIKFIEKGTDFVSSCEVKCKEGTCNKGKCDATYPYGPLCDCSNSPFNGRHCNRTLRSYVRGKNTSFEQRDWSKLIQFKLSWKQNTSRTFCLMDLIYRSHSIVITVNKDFLMKDLEIISPIKYDGTNFINVNVTESYVNIGSGESKFSLKITSLEKFKLDVGFSRSKVKCDTFSGKYDFHYNKYQIQGASKYVEPSKISAIWIVVPVLIIVIAIGAVLVVQIIRRKHLNDSEKVPEKPEEDILDEQKINDSDRL